jgi:16S rRNA (cytosine967-C5)-methyltransferase
VLQIQKFASQTIAAVLAGASLTAALESLWRTQRQLTSSERGAIQDICYGTLRHLGKFRAVLDQLARKPVADAELQALLLSVLYQLEYTKVAAYAVVDHAVENAAQLGGQHLRPFANAILRNYQRRRNSLLASAMAQDEGRFSYPGWWIEKLRNDFGMAADGILDIGNQHPPMTLRANVRRPGADEYLSRLRQAGLGARSLANGAILLDRPLPVERLPGFGAGEVSVQDAGAQLAAPMLGSHDAMRVLDACAAPGGKTAHILELANVELTALDADAVRLQKVGANLQRLGLRAHLRACDAAEVDTWWDGKPFDRILLDAPCTGSGVVRRHPDIKWLRRRSDIRAFGAQQLRLLDALWKVLARDGKLLYVTCSIFPEEGQQKINEFAARQRDARILGGMPGRDGLLLPDDEHDGFFYALLQKD